MGFLFFFFRAIYVGVFSLGLGGGGPRCCLPPAGVAAPLSLYAHTTQPIT
jgi:hypothetical protein